jgi:hypothetical protein
MVGGVRTRHGAYQRILLSTVGAGLLGVVAVNAWVDPLAALDGPRVRGWNAEKTEAIGMGTRPDKSVRIAVEPFDTLVFGSSRVQLAIDPDDPAFGGRPAFNAGLGATNLAELVPVVDYALARQRPRRVLVGLDLLMASSRREPGAGFAASAFSGRHPAAVWLRRVASWDVLRASLATVRANRAGESALYAANGFVRGPADASLEDWDYAAQFETSLRTFALNPETYACFRYDAERVARLADALDALRRSDARVFLFFDPMHARHLELLETLGLGPDLERMKREVVDLVAAEAARSRAAPFPVWDFSGPHPYTTEPVPPAGGEMRWWWESSHATPALGSRMVARMLGEDARDAEDEGFGVRLAPEGLDAHLAALRLRHAAWAEANPAAVQAVRGLVRRTERTRRALCRGLDRARLDALRS